MKKVIALTLALSMLFTFLAACAGVAAPPNTEMPVETLLFTDSAERVIEVPANIERIAVTGPLAQMVLFALAPDLMVGIAAAWDPSASKYLDTKYMELHYLGALYGTRGDLNLETLLVARPDIVIDIGESKDSIAEDMDALQEKCGIPFVHISASTVTTGETYRKLGELLNMKARAEALAVYCEDIYTMTFDLMERVGEENRVSLVYCMGDTGLNVLARGSFHAEVLDMMGLNAAVLDNPTAMGTGNEVDMEQLLVWNPEVILFAPGSVYDMVGGDPVWSQLSAISNGRYFETPIGPYNWLGFPPSVQLYLGMLWLGYLMYPEYVDYDLYEKVAEYYALFYHSELTREMFAELTVNAL